MKPRLPVDIQFLMESVLSEDPDVVYVDGDDSKRVRFNDYELSPWAFIIFDTFSIIGRELKHSQLINNLYHARLRGNSQRFFSMMRDAKVYVSDMAAAEKEIKSKTSKLGMFLDWKENDAGLEPWADWEVYRTELGISGRLWTSKKILAFWNKKNDVIKRFHDVENMFNRFSQEIGDLNDYSIDFLERSVDFRKPLVPASSISKSVHSADKVANKDAQEDFMDKLFAEPSSLPKLSDEELKELQRKIHTLPPDKKKIALKIMGMKNVKAQEIADKLDMTVAEFNHIMHVNESNEHMPSLTELLKKTNRK